MKQMQKYANNATAILIWCQRFSWS